jgi:eukaryotic-like serine/threonine-protein kinase
MAGGSPWIVMELVRGPALSDVLDAEGALEPRRAAGAGTSGGGTATTTRPPSSSSPSELRITVQVSAVRDSYTGTCPPSADAAPSFSAVITVNRTPVQVVYRWTTSDGGSSDPEWRTADFPAGGAKSRTVNHTELTYLSDRTHTDWMAVKVKVPQSLESGHMPYTVSCEASPSTTPSTTASTTAPTGTTSP